MKHSRKIIKLFWAGFAVTTLPVLLSMILSAVTENSGWLFLWILIPVGLIANYYFQYNYFRCLHCQKFITTWVFLAAANKHICCYSCGKPVEFEQNSTDNHFPQPNKEEKETQ